jgi:hypothetical protein
MLVDVPVRPIDSNVNNGQDFSFRLDNESSIIFDILRNRMYKNPVRAVCREISMNARDANKEVGNGHIPIDIIMPGEFMTIKDCGPGISPQRMREIYCVYGKSTKRGDNDQHGGYGIGSKTPFAVTDQFTVETVVDEIKYVYAAYIDETNIGNIKLISEDLTDEPNGTSVKVPVSSLNKEAFRKYLVECTRFWDVQPRFLGEYFVDELPKPTIKADKWELYLSGTTDINVLYDGTPYQDTQSGIPKGVVLKFGVGEIDITSTREELHYSEKTQQALRDAFGVYKEQVAEYIREQLESVEHFHDVISVIHSVPGYADNPREWEWRGHRFTYPFDCGNEIQVYEKGRARLASWYTRTFSHKLFPEQVILLDKDEVTSYDKQKIRSRFEDCPVGTKKLYLIKPGILPAGNYATLSSLKVKRAPNNGGGQTKYPGYIRGYVNRRTRSDRYAINSTVRVAYTTDEWDNLANTSMLPIIVLKIAKRNVKLIENQPNWIALDAYLQENLYGRLNGERVQQVLDVIESQDEYSQFKFLAKHNPDFEYLGRTKMFGYDIAELRPFVMYEAKLRELTSTTPDLYIKYPMLEFVSYLAHNDKDNQQKVIDYVNLVNPVSGIAAGASSNASV